MCCCLLVWLLRRCLIVFLCCCHSPWLISIEQLGLISYLISPSFQSRGRLQKSSRKMHFEHKLRFIYIKNETNCITKTIPFFFYFSEVTWNSSSHVECSHRLLLVLVLRCTTKRNNQMLFPSSNFSSLLVLLGVKNPSIVLTNVSNSSSLLLLPMPSKRPTQNVALVIESRRKALYTMGAHDTHF